MLWHGSEELGGLFLHSYDSYEISENKSGKKHHMGKKAPLRLKAIAFGMKTLDDRNDACPNLTRNTGFCACTYASCPRHGLCCECVQYHQKKDQTPGCFFPPEVEKTYDRSYRKFAETYS